MNKIIKLNKQQNRLFFQVLTRMIMYIGVFSVVFFVLLYLFIGPLRPVTSAVLHKVFGDSYYTAIDFLMGLIIPVFVLVVVGFILYAMYKSVGYTQEVVSAMEGVLAEDEKLISLPVELAATEVLLNQLKINRLRNERLVKEAEQRKNDLVMYLAHDIRTPLTSVVGYLSLLEEAQDMPLAQRQKYVGIALEKAYRLETLMEEFFDITRFNLQTILLEKQMIDLPHMLLQMSEEFYPLVAQQGKSIEVEAEEELTVFADGDKLARVLNNVLKNAVSYSAANSVIELTAKRQGDGVEIEIQNTGQTIPPQRLENIFEMFYRLDSARSSSKGGAGLGLAIAKEIVEAHGGSISAEREKGVTTFKIWLPNTMEDYNG